MKHVNPDLTSDSIGRMGVHTVGAIVSNLGWFFREQPISDFGVDAHVEAPNALGQPSGRLLALQIKAGKRWFQEKLTDGVVYRGSLRHLAYWKEHSLPVVLVLYDPTEKDCFWQVVQEGKIEPTAKGWKIVIPFDQKVDESAMEAWWRLCTNFLPSPPTTLTISEKVSFKSPLLKFAKAFCDVSLNKIGKRYRPELYVRRQPDAFVWEWLTTRDTSNAQCLILVERAGSGKTNLICNIAQRLLAEERLCVLMLGSDPLNDRLGLVSELLRALGFEPGSRDRMITAIHELAAATDGSPLCILIDAINETRDVELMQTALAELLAWLQPLPVRILISCRDIYWHFLKGDWAEIVKSDIRSLDLYQYDLESWPEVRDRYLKAFRIRGRLSGDAEEKCRHPLLFRFFCEAYEGDDVSEVSQIRLKPLFERYLEKKVQRVALQNQSLFRAEESVTGVLQSIAAEMLTTRDMSVPEGRIPSLTGESQHLRRDSIYIRLLDEDIIIEEIPDERSPTLARRVRFVYEAFLEFMLAREMTVRWRQKTNDEVIEDLLNLLEPGTGLRNTLGALSFLGDLFIARDLSVWRILSERGATWQSLVLASLRECPPENLDSLQLQAFPTLLTASSFETRAAAVHLLLSDDARRILDPKNQQILARFQSDERREVRLAALDVLKGAWDELKLQQRVEVAAAVLDPSKAVRASALSLLPQMKPPELEQLLVVLEKALSSQSGKTRSYAAMALRLNYWPEARTLLITSLRDENPWVRRACLIRLQKYPARIDKRAIEPLLADPETKVRSLAAILCGKWKYPGFVGPLLKRIHVEENGTVLSRLVEALVLIKAPKSRYDVVPFLKTMLNNENYWVRSHAGRGLYGILGRKSLDDLVQSFSKNPPLGGWFKHWPMMDAVGGPNGVLQLCKQNFVSSDFSQETGAFLAGVFTPSVMIQLDDDEEGVDIAIEEWFVQRVPQLSPGLVDWYLRGFRSSGWRLHRCFNNAKSGMRQVLSDLLLSGPDLLRPHACYLLTACAGPLRRMELDVILSHPLVELRQQLASGIIAESPKLTKELYWVHNPPRKSRVIIPTDFLERELYNPVNPDLSDDDLPF
jgi:HEAT repeat protein